MNTKLSLFLDFDGTISETENIFTLNQFNRMFEKKKMGIVWDDEIYRELLKVGASEARLFHYFNKFDCWPIQVDGFKTQEYALEDDKKKALCRFLKEAKDFECDAILTEVIHNREISPSCDNGLGSSNSHSKLAIYLRPGIDRLVRGALLSNANVAVCSNSPVYLVKALLSTLFPHDVLQHIRIFGGDDSRIAKVKPAPDLYLLAAKEFNLDLNFDMANRVVVVEDTITGVQAAREAGVGCVIATKSYFTTGDDFASATVVVDSLEDVFDEGVDDGLDWAYIVSRYLSKEIGDSKD